MKALTIYNPHATLIYLGYKTIETRPWKTNYRGDLLIHAGMKPMRNDQYENMREEYSDLPELEPNDFIYGALLCVAQLVDCRLVEDITCSDLELFLGDHTPGRYGWILEDITWLKVPIRHSGLQKLWDVRDELLAGQI